MFLLGERGDFILNDFEGRPGDMRSPRVAGPVVLFLGDVTKTSGEDFVCATILGS
jgi:hypothetical protein